MENENNVETKSASGNAKIFAILSYIGILWLLGLLIEPEKNDPFVKNHVNNGIILSIAGAALGILGVIPIVQFLAAAVSVAILVFCIMGLIAACTDKEFTIPIVGDKVQIIK
ncbi:MAG: DUF4870 domain-containing protein [Saccharofermentans sp.]|nr:DUF4870 domain-containing protein [Saccharofermentans sp.]